MLERLYGFYEGLAIALAGDALWSARVRERAALLALDLTDLGLGPSGLRALPRCVAFNRFEDSSRTSQC